MSRISFRIGKHQKRDNAGRNDCEYLLSFRFIYLSQDLHYMTSESDPVKMKQISCYYICFFLLSSLCVCVCVFVLLFLFSACFIISMHINLCHIHLSLSLSLHLCIYSSIYISVYLYISIYLCIYLFLY